MNIALILYICSVILMINAGLLALPAIVGLIYREYSHALVYVICACCCALLGFLGSRRKPAKRYFYEKEGLASVALSWLMISVIGALPLWITKDIPSFINALFEVVSGFTTTGASILNDVTVLSHAGLFWRSFSHLIGGMGILLFMLTILPSLGGTSFQLMKAESPGPSVGKLVPKLKTGALILYAIYLGMTLVLILLYLLGGMSLFDSLLLAFGTAGTGGFGLLNDSFTSYSDYIQIVTAIFMLLYGLNFSLYFLLLIGKPKEFFKNEEMRFFLCAVLLSVVIISLNILPMYNDYSSALKDSLFQVSSLVSSTGYSNADFNTWPLLSKTILLLLMFMGACAGSTGGGFKVSRILILVKGIRYQFYSFFHPHGVKIVKLENQPLDEDLLKRTWIYLCVYGLIFLSSLLLISLDNKDFTSSFTSILACINNIGPGLNAVGPTQNYESYSVLSKIVLMFDMLAGRLELYPLLVFFLPQSWKGSLKKTKTIKSAEK